MEEVLSLKWNNHENSFIQLLSILRNKNIYTDVMLACDGLLYNVHKIVLSACSNYFSNIFENITCVNPVIILKDISAFHLELLLDYMYMGEAKVSRCELPAVIRAAECLKVKGLAGADIEALNNRKRHKSDSSPVLKKRIKKSPVQPTSRSIPVDNTCDETPVQPTLRSIPVDNTCDETPLQPSDNVIAELKIEDNSDSNLLIKDEPIDATQEYTGPWEFTSDKNQDSIFNEGQNLNNESKNDSSIPAVPSSSKINVNYYKMHKNLPPETIELFLDKLIQEASWYERMKGKGMKKDALLQQVAAKFPELVNRNVSDLMKNLGREYRDMRRKMSVPGTQPMIPMLRRSQLMFLNFEKYQDVFFPQKANISEKAPTRFINDSESVEFQNVNYSVCDDETLRGSIYHLVHGSDDSK